MTIYFKNLETITIDGKEGELVKREIAHALEHTIKDYIMIYTDKAETKKSIPSMIIKLDEIIAVR
jgi:hypothetical protein